MLLRKLEMEESFVDTCINECPIPQIVSKNKIFRAGLIDDGNLIVHNNDTGKNFMAK